jgi:Leucine-rich repeat (LRR) protein
VRQYRPEVPAELDAVVARMLAREPNMRYATPAEVARALAPFASGTAGSVPAAGPGLPSPAGLSTAGPSAVTTGSTDVTADSSLHGFPAELHAITAAKPVRPAAVPTSGIWHDHRLQIAGAIAGMLLVLGLAWSIFPGRKGAAPDRARHATDSSKGNHHGDAGESDATAAESEVEDEIDPERETAKWILGRGGIVSVRSIGRSGTRSKKTEANQTTDAGTDDSQVIHDAVEVPARTFHIVGVEWRGNSRLAPNDLARLAKLPRLESLSLAGAPVADAEVASFKDIRTLVRLDLQDTPVSDAGVMTLKNLPNLQALQLSRTRITGAALERLASLTSLRELQLEGTAVRDRDLKHLRGLPEINLLNLARTEITGAVDPAAKGPSLNYVWELKELTTLDLSGLHLRPNALKLPQRVEVPVRILRLTGAKVNDDALKNLSGMTSLRELSLGSTTVTDEGMKHLTWMAALEHLDLADTVVGDRGLKVLGGLTSLKSLNLAGTVVSDDGLVHLRTLKELQALDLSGSKVTATGVANLRQELPGCKITD